MAVVNSAIELFKTAFGPLGVVTVLDGRGNWRLPASAGRNYAAQSYFGARRRSGVFIKTQKSVSNASATRTNVLSVGFARPSSSACQRL
jgi:hypothetical protein